MSDFFTKLGEDAEQSRSSSRECDSCDVSGFSMYIGCAKCHSVHKNMKANDNIVIYFFLWCNLGSKYFHGELFDASEANYCYYFLFSLLLLLSRILQTLVLFGEL